MHPCVACTMYTMRCAHAHPLSSMPTVQPCPHCQDAPSSGLGRTTCQRELHEAGGRPWRRGHQCQPAGLRGPAPSSEQLPAAHASPAPTPGQTSPRPPQSSTAWSCRPCCRIAKLGLHRTVEFQQDGQSRMKRRGSCTGVPLPRLRGSPSWQAGPEAA